MNIGQEKRQDAIKRPGKAILWSMGGWNFVLTAMKADLSTASEEMKKHLAGPSNLPLENVIIWNFAGTLDKGKINAGVKDQDFSYLAKMAFSTGAKIEDYLDKTCEDHPDGPQIFVWMEIAGQHRQMPQASITVPEELFKKIQGGQVAASAPTVRRRGQSPNLGKPGPVEASTSARSLAPVAPVSPPPRLRSAAPLPRGEEAQPMGGGASTPPPPPPSRITTGASSSAQHVQGHSLGGRPTVMPSPDLAPRVVPVPRSRAPA